jgi:hypothetical protein
MDWSIVWIVKKFNSKLSIVTKDGLKNEIIKLSVNCFFVKPKPNDSYELLKGSNYTLFSKVLLKLMFFVWNIQMGFYFYGH